MSEFSYIGTELEVFENATNWKKYYGQHLAPYLGEEVLEVGAGIGGTTKSLCGARQTRWVCLEPDKEMTREIEKAIAAGELPAICEARNGSLADFNDDDEKFDTIIYIDVLEHIEKDEDELRLAARSLKSGGHLVVLSPAHQFLYTPFDKAIGHFRRYNKQSLSQVVPEQLKRIKLLYLDSVGVFASLGNKMILQSPSPTHDQIQLWDKKLVPLSRFFDTVFRYKIGKSILGVWQKD
jgi:2-polyprenyl-3-methyl-5-hydroxy-6-metoxy-1,4-benzoquinol methylase